MTKEEREKLEKEKKEAEGLETPPSDPDDGLEVSVEEPPVVKEPVVVDPFAGIPELEGKTPEEAAHLYQLQKNVAEGLKREADERFEREQAITTEPVEVTPEEYYADPAKYTREMIREELAATVAPFVRDQATVRGEQIFDQFRANATEYPEFAELEPYIQQYIETNKGDPSNVNVVHWAYIAARGSRGLPGGPPAEAKTTEVETVVTRPGERVVPPQHSPSSQPIEDATPKKRKLTEDERRLAKEYGLTHDEYRAGQTGDVMELGRVGEGGGE